MNREYKFRAWVDNLKEPYMAIQGNPDLETLQSFMYHYGDKPNLMQLTGLKDKNGKEIYEGDIVNAAWMHHGEPGEQFRAFILYNEHIGSYRIGYDSLDGGSQDEIYPRYQVEVIGNIYENKNLLQVKAERIKNKEPQPKDESIEELVLLIRGMPHSRYTGYDANQKGQSD